MISVVVAGDFCPPLDVVKKLQDGTANIEMPETVIKGADYAVINLETPLTDKVYRPISKCGPNIKRPTIVANVLTQYGFGLATMANNHIFDYGEDAMRDTLELCRERGIDTVGVGQNATEAAKTFFKNIKDKTIAFINCCEHEFSIATDRKAGANPLNPIKQFYAIKEAREKADYVIVITHGGNEGMKYPTTRMVETYRFFIDAGADAVVNHHQHVFSGYEVYNDKPIFYGLGNYYMTNATWSHRDWTRGYMVRLLFDEKVDFEIIPYVQLDNNDSVILLEDKSAFEKEVNDLNDVIANPSLLRSKNTEKYDRISLSYLSALSPYPNKKVWMTLYSKSMLPTFITSDRIRYMAALIQNETHHEIFTYLLHKRIGME